MDVFVGTETGLLKGVNLKESVCKSFNAASTSDDVKSHQIVSLCFTNSSTSGGDETEILCGLLNKKLKLFDSVAETFTDLFTVDGGSGEIRGLEMVENNILTCVESGLVKLWGLDGTDKNINIAANANLCRMRKCPTESNIFATAGKENPLKVWDLQKPATPLFVSKNIKNNFLDLRNPIWDTDLRFLSRDLVVACTGNHAIRMYDLRLEGRRPCLQINFENDPFTAISTCFREKQILAGTNRGFLGLFDLRSPGKLLHSYKGFAGSISSVEAHPFLPFVATCGLDRFFRMHNLDDRKMVNKIYCKSRLNGLLIKRNLTIEKQEEKVADNEGRSTHPASLDDDVIDEEYWSKMPTVGADVEAGKKRHATDDINEKTTAGKRKCDKNLKKRDITTEDVGSDTEKAVHKKKVKKTPKKIRRRSSSEEEGRIDNKDCFTISRKLKKLKTVENTMTSRRGFV